MQLARLDPDRLPEQPARTLKAGEGSLRVVCFLLGSTIYSPNRREEEQ